MKRDTFQSRIGFLLVSAGCAIGIGNVWRFPFVAGQNGGGLFVGIYLLFLLLMGLPVLTMELAVGRASRLSAIRAYEKLERKGSRWHLHGWVALLGNYILMMYYTTVSGWMLSYFVRFLCGSFTPGMSSEKISGVFGSMLGSPVEMTLFMSIIVVAGFLVCSRSLQKGLEKVSRVMMSALLGLILILVVHSFFLPGALEGIRFYLVPDFSSMEKIGSVITAAMNQAFFTLSLGIAAMEIFGSYMSKDHTLVSEGIQICLLDTFVAVCAGLIIFPACFSYGVQVNAGPGLIFETLPNVFVNMAGGRIWGMLFFMFMTFASFSTVIAVFENIISTCMDTFGWSRRKTVLINLIVVLIISMPSILGYNVLKDVTLIGGRDILDSEDFIVSNLLLPLGSLIYLLFCVSRYGWGFENYQKEANTGKGIRIPSWLRWYFLFAVPAMILVILIQGLI